MSRLMEKQDCQNSKLIFFFHWDVTKLIQSETRVAKNTYYLLMEKLTV